VSNNDKESEEKNKQIESPDNVAFRKYEEFKLKDPYPYIPFTLLNWNDIKRYAEKVGMIFPFYSEPKNKYFKEASYGARLLGRCVFWGEKGKEDRIVKEGDEFVLKKNSIAFVSVEPRFRIPYYIALRFNLEITFIHRGILLGTGPLVDPGFDGTLCIPLHNLTNNDYVLRGGDVLIWIEFTKISSDCYSCKKDQGDELKTLDIKDVVEFPSEKNIKDVNDYLYKAYQGNPIRSSLSDIRQIASRAERNFKLIKNIGFVSLLALMATVILPILGLISDSTNYVKEAKKDFLEQRLNEARETEQLRIEIQNLKGRIEVIEEKLKSRPREPKIPGKTIAR
jgi:deoxycytidine triphosphate deaminase